MEVRPLIAIPVFNEEINLPDLLPKLSKWQEDILLFDDGSTDDSISYIKKSGYRYISKQQNIGLAGFYKLILAEASRLKRTHIITLDSDGQHPPAFIDDYTEKLSRNTLVIGNRFSSITNIPENKIASNFFAIMLTRHIFGRKLPDVACGFRGFEVDLFYRMNFQTNRFGIIYEQLFSQLSQGSSSIDEVRIPAIYPPDHTLYTSQQEVIGLLDAAILFNDSLSLKKIHQEALQNHNFSIVLGGVEFSAFINPELGYIFKTDRCSAEVYFEQFSHEGNN